MSTKSRKKPRASLNPLKLVLISGGLLLVALVTGLLFAKSMLNGWLRGEGFGNWLTARASQVLRSDVSLGELEWDGSEVFTKRIEALGREEAGFSELVLDGVSARAGGIEDKAFRVPEVAVNRLELKFSPERRGIASGAAPASLEEVPADGGGAALPGWLLAYLPDRVEVEEIEVANARVSVEKAEGEVFLLSGAGATLRPDFRTGFWEIEGKGGSFTLPKQPELALKDLGLRWRGGDLFVDRCALGVFETGHIDGKGEIGLESPGRFDLELDFSGVNVDDLLEGEWRDRLAGTIRGPVRITGAPGALVCEGTIHLDEGVIEAMPLLKRISQYTRSERFERLVLNQAQTDFKWSDDRLELRNLILQSDGLVRVEGEADLVGDQIAGEFQIGVTPGTMRWIPGAERLVFNQERAGFLWAPMKLSGSLAAPTEDLSARLIAAAGESVVSELPSGVIDAAQGLLKGGEAEPGASDLIDQGKKVIDLLTPFLKAP